MVGAKLEMLTVFAVLLPTELFLGSQYCRKLHRTWPALTCEAKASPRKVLAVPPVLADEEAGEKIVQQTLLEYTMHVSKCYV